VLWDRLPGDDFQRREVLLSEVLSFYWSAERVFDVIVLECEELNVFNLFPCWIKALWPNKPDAVNPAMTLRLTIEDQWRRIGDPCRSAQAAVGIRQLEIVLWQPAGMLCA